MKRAVNVDFKFFVIEFILIWIIILIHVVFSYPLLAQAITATGTQPSDVTMFFWKVTKFLNDWYWVIALLPCVLIPLIARLDLSSKILSYINISLLSFLGLSILGLTYVFL